MNDTQMVELLRFKAKGECERMRGMTTAGRDPYLPGVLLEAAADRIAGLSEETGWLCSHPECEKGAELLYVLERPMYWGSKEMGRVDHPRCSAHPLDHVVDGCIEVGPLPSPLLYPL